MRVALLWGRIVPADLMTRATSKRPPFELPSPSVRRRIGALLLGWYRMNRRELPWRGSSDPYVVWVSEIMLQQTRVATARPYFERWMRAFPDVAALARASEDQVLEQWQGLGYYSRARSLRWGAQHVVAEYQGRMPSTAAELRTLPGIGPYTAGAIASIAFHQPEPVVDGNVIRVLTRLFALHGDPARAPLKNYLWELARALLIEKHAGEFNQAVMELGALCCTPRQPNCLLCPLRTECKARRAREPERYPELPPRKPVTELEFVAAIATRRGRHLVGQLPDTAPRWASMWQFPNVAIEPDETAQEAAQRALSSWCGLAATRLQAGSTLRHTVTRYRIRVTSFHATPGRGRAQALGCASVRWCTARELEMLAMPAAHRRLARDLGKTAADGPLRRRAD